MLPQQIEETEIQALERETKVAKTHYVDNKKMLAAMCAYRASILKFREDLATQPNLTKPRLPEYIGVCILEIAHRLSSKPNFANYVHREEMIGDGVECCIKYVDNFDPAKSSNPFAYFTQVIYHAFLRRIEQEKKHMYVKMKMVERMDKKGDIRRRAVDQNPLYNEKPNPYADLFSLNETDVSFWEEKAKSKKKKKPQVSKKKAAKKIKKIIPPVGGLTQFFDK